MVILCALPELLRCQKAVITMPIPYLFVSLFSSSSVCAIICAYIAPSVVPLSVLLYVVTFVPLITIIFTVARTHQEEINSIQQRYEKQVCGIFS